MSHSEHHREAISIALKAAWARRKEAKAKEERKIKRDARRLAKLIDKIENTASGVKVKLPKGTTIKDGKVKPPSPNIGRTKPQIYASKTKRTYRPAK
jgi:hypothetical protein